MKTCPAQRFTGTPKGQRTPLLSVAAAMLLVLTSVAPASAASWTAYVANRDDGTVTPIDTGTNTAGAPIPVGSQPVAIAITPDGSTAWVVNEGDGTVTPIDTATNTAGAPIAVEKASRIAITPDGSKAYVSSWAGSLVTPIDLVTRTAGAPIDTFPVFPGPIAISPDGRTAYVFSRFGGGPVVMPINTASDTLGTKFAVGTASTALFSPDGSTIYLAYLSGTPLSALDVAAQTSTFRHEFNEPWRAIPNLAISPDGATLYWGSYEAFAELDVTGGIADAPTSTALGTFSGRTVAITPDGATVYVANNSDDNVLPYDTTTKTFGAPIAVGGYPVAIAITPDQAPLARLSVTRAPIGSPTTFDASASTVKYGTIDAYLWDFGDGTFDVTATPTTTHLYTTGSHTASVTTISSGGTSFATIFTGQTALRRGRLSARATALGTLAGLGAPVVGSVTPGRGVVTGATEVSIIGSGFTGTTGVTFGGVAATGFVVNGDNSITATTPAGAGAGWADVVVTNAAGVSAVNGASRFLYLGSVPVVEVPCNSASCAIQLGTPAVQIQASTDPCPVCTFQGGVEPIVIPQKCPAGQSGQIEAGWLEVQQRPTSVLSSIVADFNYAMTTSQWYEDGEFDKLKLVNVCWINGIPVATGGALARAQAVEQPAKATLLKSCEQTRDVPPCVVSKRLVDGTAKVRLLLPEGGSTFAVGVASAKPGTPKPNHGLAGDSFTLRGQNMDVVKGVVVGGVDATIASRDGKQLVVVIPDGARSGLVTLLTYTGSVSTRKPLYVGPTIVRMTRAGKVGGKVRLTGYNLADATAVDFNGTSGTIVSADAKGMIVTVPDGATTGPITVTTPIGTAIGPVDFTVR